MESFRWLGLEWDEGPYYQSERISIHQEYVQKLLEDGKAYKCFCTPEELDRKRQAAQKAKENYRYDGKCLLLTPDQIADNEASGLSSAVRLKVNSDGQTRITDIIKGELTFENSEIDDFIIQRSNGRPIYNFVVAIDDALMKISHVIRAEEHLKNTLRQYFVYQALGLAVPEFAHVPMVLAADRSKLSKRHGATAVFEYRDKGILPEALVNYLVRLGWSHGDQEIFTQQELIEKFALEDVNDSAAVFDEEKLLWLNHQYIMAQDEMELSNKVADNGIQRGSFTKEDWVSIPTDRRIFEINELKLRHNTLNSIADSTTACSVSSFVFNVPAREKFLTSDKSPLLNLLIESIKNIDEKDFTPENLDQKVRASLVAAGYSLKDIAQSARVALVEDPKGIGLFETIYILGKERSIGKLNDALSYITEKRTTP